MAAKLVLETGVRGGFSSRAPTGFRPKRNATMALETLRDSSGRRGGHHVLDGRHPRTTLAASTHEEVADCFLVASKRISDRRILKLLRQWLEAGSDGGRHRPSSADGGGARRKAESFRPCSSNIYLHVLDAAVGLARVPPWGTLVRYADDFVVMCRHREAMTSSSALAGVRIRVILERGLGSSYIRRRRGRVNL